MDRTDIAGLLFALVGGSWLVRFAIDPALTAYALVSIPMGVGFLSAGVLMFRHERQSHATFDETPVVPAVALATFLLGVAVFFAV